MKKRLRILFLLIFVLMFLTSFTSAFSFSDLFGKITGGEVTEEGGTTSPPPTNGIVSSSCTDTDGGIDINVFGIANDINGILKDRCVSTTEIEEQYCISNLEKGSLSINCPSGQACENGFCTTPSVTPSVICTDTDNGLDFSVRGSATDINGMREDRCVSTTKIEEQYCISNLEKGSLSINCPRLQSICNNGVCVMSGTSVPIETKCIDYDVDGYGYGCSLGLDCNDSNNDINPDAAEFCDNIDSNCDGDISRECIPPERIPPLISSAEVSPEHSNVGTIFIITSQISDSDGVSITNPPTALIQKPDETIIATIILFDDGEHGDSIAGDGIYGNLWDSTAQSIGQYFIDITATDTLGNSVELEKTLQFSISGTICVVIINNGPSDTKLDVVFIGSGFPTLENFDQVVNEMIDYNGQMDGLLSVEPFKSNKNKFNFWRIDELYTFPDISIDNSINYYKGYAESLVKTNCPFVDETVLLIIAPTNNAGTWGSFSGTINGVMEGGHYLQVFVPQFRTFLRRAFIHEFGHSFGGLADEYVYGGEFSIYYTPYPTNANCDVAGCSKWCPNNICIEDASCIEGCSYDSWYRAYNNTVMRYFGNGGTKEYKAINEKRLQEVLNRYE